MCKIVDMVSAAALADVYFIKSRDVGSDVSNDERSSLIVQMQSVSESPIKNIICREDSSCLIFFSYERAFKRPGYLICSLYLR